MDLAEAVETHDAATLDFATWMRHEMNGRGWNGSDLARQMNLSAGTVGNVLNGNRSAGPSFCIGLAQALGLPREVVFQARGWLGYPPTQPVVPAVGDFVEWIRRELTQRGWDQATLAQRMGVSSGSIANVLTGNRGAGPAFCIALAQALGLPREVVFRARGWLLYTPQTLVAPDLPDALLRMVETVRHLPPPAQDEVLAVWARTLAMACVLLGKVDAAQREEGV